jgi:hypothetical protein
MSAACTVVNSDGRLPAVFGHVRVDAGGNVVVNGANQVDLHALLPHDPGAEINDALGVAHLGAAFQGAVDEDGAQAGVVKGCLFGAAGFVHLVSKARSLTR